MRALKSWLMRQIILCMAVSLIVPLGAAETNPDIRTRRDAGKAAAKETPAARPWADAATIGEAGPPTAFPENPRALKMSGANQFSQNIAPQNTQNKQDTQTAAPLGTAAAPYQKQEGISASKPGGAAIAPAKQRRIRSFAIRIGLLVGAGIAIGVVTAATLSSPSRP